MCVLIVTAKIMQEFFKTDLTAFCFEQLVVICVQVKKVDVRFSCHFSIATVCAQLLCRAVTVKDVVIVTVLDDLALYLV